MVEVFSWGITKGACCMVFVVFDVVPESPYS